MVARVYITQVRWFAASYKNWKLYYLMFTGCWHLSVYYQYAWWHLCKNSKSIKKAKQNKTNHFPPQHSCMGATLLVCWHSITTSWSYTLELYIQNEFIVHPKTIHCALKTFLSHGLINSWTVHVPRILKLYCAHKISNRAGFCVQRYASDRLLA